MLLRYYLTKNEKHISAQHDYFLVNKLASETLNLIITIIIALIVTILANLILEYFNISKRKTRLFFISLLIVSIFFIILLQAAQEFGIPASISDPSQLFAGVSAITSFIIVILTFLQLRASIRILKETVKPEKHQNVQPHTDMSETIQNKQKATTRDLNIGETAKTTTTEVTVFSVKKSNTYKWGMDPSVFTDIASTGNIYIIANVEIKNIGSDSLLASLVDFSVVDPDGYKYDVLLAP